MIVKIIYEDENLLVIDKPAGIIVFSERKVKDKVIIDFLLGKFAYLKNVGSFPRYGIVHRLDKETSGILLVAKNNKILQFLQKEFKERRVKKTYLALVIGHLKLKQGKIETLIGRDPGNWKKQKAFSLNSPEAKKEGLREATTEYKIISQFCQNKGSHIKLTLVEVDLKTGRKHQIRCHFSYIGHPVAGDKLYGFKNHSCPENLKRHFLHASCLKIKLPEGEKKAFKSNLPDDLKNIIEKLK